MADLLLTQPQADALIALAKYRLNETKNNLTGNIRKLSIPLQSEDHREQFMLDLNRGRIVVSQITYQNRARKTIPLVRLDVDGPPHRNPDGVEIPCPHLHVYREGYGDKWAAPIDPQVFTATSDIGQTLDEFMDYCNIAERPVIDLGVLP